MPRSVLLLGATGLVGRECLQQLLSNPAFDRIVVLARRPVPNVQSAPVLSMHVVDFDRLEEHADLFAVDAIICALGTTIKQAGSQEAFRRVDFDYPLAAARIGVARGVRHYALVSALGASATSRVFYNRVKGELEGAISALPFRSVTIVRPSLLLGKRTQFRLGEQIGKRFAWLVPAKYKPIEARDVAATMVSAVEADREGARIVESAAMRARN